MRGTMRRLLAMGATWIALVALAPSAGAFTFTPTVEGTFVPPVGYLSGPCGLGVDSEGRLYVSDYYHHAVDVFAKLGNEPEYLGQAAGVDPLDGPCGLALDSSDRLYVNNFDRNVSRFATFPSFGTATTIAGAGVDSAHPTGVAVDPATDDVYVNNRTYVTGYDSGGAQLSDGPDPLRIGEGTLGEGYGMTIDALGRLYVADAADDTVKVYDQAVSKTTPVTTITGPPGGFVSLRHSALAVDRETGTIYVVDNLQPQYAERPLGVVDVFNSSGAYLGHLRAAIVDALPPGIAVDNSGGNLRGNVYVTSGNTIEAGIYGYLRGSQTTSELLPPEVPKLLNASGSGTGAVSAAGPTPIECGRACAEEALGSASLGPTALGRRVAHRTRHKHRRHARRRAGRTLNATKKSR